MEVLNKAQLNSIAAGLSAEIDLQNATFSCTVTRDDMEYLYANVPAEELEALKASEGPEAELFEKFEDAFSNNATSSLTISGNSTVVLTQDLSELVFVTK